MQAFSDFLNDPLVLKIAKTLLWILVLASLIVFLRKMAKRRIANVTYRYKVQKTIEIVGFFLIAIVVLMSITLDNFKDYTVIIGLFTAGIAFTPTRAYP